MNDTDRKELSPEERIEQLESARRANLEQEKFLEMQRRDAALPSSSRSQEEQQKEMDRLGEKSAQVQDRLADIQAKLDSARGAAGIDPVAARKAQEENKELDAKLGEIEAKRKMELSELDKNAETAEKRLGNKIKDAQDKDDHDTVKQLEEKLNEAKAAIAESRDGINEFYDREKAAAKEQNERSRADPAREDQDRPR
jgi:DNA repair exonuclease SbcCD ATPase subunit